MTKTRILLWAIIESLGVAVYVVFIIYLLNNLAIIAANAQNTFGQITFLMLFVLSALITGLLVFGHPVILFVKGQAKDAARLLFYTSSSLAVITLLSILFILSI